MNDSSSVSSSEREVPAAPVHDERANSSSRVMQSMSLRRGADRVSPAQKTTVKCQRP